MSYRFYHVIAESIFPDTLRILTRKTDATFLHSIASNNKNILGLLDKFPNIKSKMMLDSGGYSLCGYPYKVDGINEHVLMKTMQRLKPNVVVGPDFPIEGSYECSLELTSFRTKLFHLITGDNLNSKYYDAVQGALSVEGVYSLKERAHWLTEITKISGDKIYGYALGRLIDASLLERAYFGMQSWSIGCKNAHILGVGAIEALALFVYMGHYCYDNITSDSKTYTIDAGEFLNVLLPKTFITGPRYCNLSKEKYQEHNEKDLICNCYVCRHYKKKYSCSMYSLAQKNAEGDESAIALLRTCLIGHNICIIQSYLDKLICLVSERKKYLEYLKEKNLKKAIAAISLVDQLLADGKDNYEQNILLLGTPPKEDSAMCDDNSND